MTETRLPETLGEKQRSTHTEDDNEEDNATWKVRFSRERTAHVHAGNDGGRPCRGDPFCGIARQKARAVKLESTLCNSVKHHACH